MRIRSRFAFTVAPLIVVAVAACSSSGSVDAADASGPAKDEASVSETVHEGGQDAATVSIEDASADGGPTMAAVDASAACVSYCSCMAMNCASEVFAGGCLYQCTTQTNWDLPCRANMCSLVQAQPNNDHCTHAFGQVQCLDE